MAFGCGSPGGRTKWGISILLAVSAVICFGSVGPVYFSTLATHDLKSFVDCAGCIQDFMEDTLHSVNATDIADKVKKIHDRNEKDHPGRDDECITKKDIDMLIPDLKELHFPDWKTECKHSCTPVMKTIPLAAALSSVLWFIAILCLIGAMIPMCMLCCGGCKKQAPVQHIAYMPVPARTPGNIPYSVPVPVGTSSPTAPTEDEKTALLST